MYIGLSFAGIQRHIVLLEDEKRKAASLRETVELMSFNPDYSIGIYRECMEKLKRLEKSISWRMEFLEDMADDFRRILNENKRLLDDLEEKLTRH